jgi:hypothetical protein
VNFNHLKQYKSEKFSPEFDKILGRDKRALPSSLRELSSAMIFQFLRPACFLACRLFFAGWVTLRPIVVASLLQPVISFEPTIFNNPSAG